MISGSIVKESIMRWWSSDPFSMGAALAYYTIFSLIPFLLLTVNIIGVFLGPEVLQSKLVPQVQEFTGPQIAQFIALTLVDVQELRFGIVANTLTVLLLVIGSFSVFSQLQFSLNKIWNVPKRRKFRLMRFLEEKISAFFMIIVFGFLFGISFFINALMQFFSTLLNIYSPHFEQIVVTTNLVFSFMLVVLMFTFIYKLLPDSDISWEVAFEGSVITGILYTVGRAAIDVYLHLSPVMTSYSATNAFIIVLLWVYYSAQVFFLGAAYTYVLDKKIKARMIPVQ